MADTTPLGLPHGDLPFSDDALRLLADARQESERLGHEYLGPEHVVLAITRQPGGPPAAVVTRPGVDLDAVQRTLTGVIHSGAGGLAPGVERPLTSRARKVVALAADSARELGHARIRSVHLLAGVMREGMNAGAQVLAHHGFTAEAAQEATRTIGADAAAP